MTEMNRKRSALLWLGLGTALFVAVVDQVTKATAINALATRDVEVTSFLNFTLGFNPGVTFGFLAAQSIWGVAALVTLTAIILALLMIWLVRSRDGIEQPALGCIIGGALGNVLDRIRQGAVTDFIDLHYAGWHWPAFNIADIGIVTGTVVLLAVGFLRPRET